MQYKSLLLLFIINSDEINDLFLSLSRDTGREPIRDRYGPITAATGPRHRTTQHNVQCGNPPFGIQGMELQCFPIF